MCARRAANYPNIVLITLTIPLCDRALNSQSQTWTLPPERIKSAKQHVVPLSTAALAVLDRQQQVRTGDAVFPGRSGAPLSYASFATAGQGSDRRLHAAWLAKVLRD